MKKMIVTALFTMLLSTIAIGQVERPPIDKFDEFIAEVYTGEGAAAIAPQTTRYTYMQDLYNERITYTQISSEHIQAKGYVSFSTVPLYNEYNEALTRDETFDPATFNIFKYRFGAYTEGPIHYHMDGTNTIISIYPQPLRNSN